MKDESTNDALSKRIGFVLFIFVLAVMTGAYILKPQKSLPIIHPKSLNPALVDPGLWNDANHFISDFQLINHLGDTVTRSDVSGKVLIVDFFFTRCATICPIMTKNLVGVQEALEGLDGYQIMSHSVTPAADSAAILKAYAIRMGAFWPNWWFLTGEKREIYRLARTSYFACYDELKGGDGGMQDFIHTENIVLVDGQGRLRGFYDGTSEDAMNQLIEDARWLLEK